MVGCELLLHVLVDTFGSPDKSNPSSSQADGRYIRGWFCLWFSVIAEVDLWCVAVQKSVVAETTRKLLPTELSSDFPPR